MIDGISDCPADWSPRDWHNPSLENCGQTVTPTTNLTVSIIQPTNRLCKPCLLSSSLPIHPSFQITLFFPPLHFFFFFFLSPLLPITYNPPGCNDEDTVAQSVVFYYRSPVYHWYCTGVLVANMLATWRRFFHPSGNDDASNPSSLYNEKCGELEINVIESSPPEATGAVKIEAVEAVGGRKGRYLLYIGYALPVSYTSTIQLTTSYRSAWSWLWSSCESCGDLQSPLCSSNMRLVNWTTLP